MTRKEASNVIECLLTDIVGDFASEEMPKGVKLTFDALEEAKKALEEVDKHEETFEWCENCKEYDQNEHCCHRWTKLIRDTVDEINENTNGKYGWHNLRKNPNDLPPEGLDRILISVDFRGIEMYAACNYEDLLFHDGINPNIKAWREIEPFEE